METRFAGFLWNLVRAMHLHHNFIYSAIYQDREDNLWVGTYGGGLCKLNIEDGKLYQLSP